jgi:signal transduction histidine kinase
MRRDSELAGTQIILVGRSRGESDLRQALDAGADSYLTKPFSISVLVREIGQVLSPLEGDPSALTELALAARREQMWLADRLAEREYQLEELVRQLFKAYEEERRRVAYDIHDGLAQLAVASQQALEQYRESARPRAAQRASLERALSLSRDTVREARHLIAGLRPVELDDLGLARAIDLEAELLREQGSTVVFEENLRAKRVPPALEIGLFRIAQEALRNIRKHANPSNVAVSLRLAKDRVRLLVEDDGPGFDTDRPAGGRSRGERVGLHGMRDRAQELSAVLSISSEPGHGTKVVVDAPLDP